MIDNLDHPGIEVVVPDATDEVFAEAARVAAKLLPRFTDIVRTSAGDSGLRVSINYGGPGPCTDGATVHLPLDPGFAAIDPNRPCVCDDDPDRCLYHITVGILLHEAAHISEGSTVPPDAEFYRRLESNLYSLLKTFPAGPASAFGSRHQRSLDRLAALKEDPASRHIDSGLQVANWFNPDAPLIANAFEDARINKAVGDRRSALGQQMGRLVHELVMRAVDGQGVLEAPLGYQVGVAVEIELEHGYDLKPALKSEAVLACLNDPVISGLVDAVPLETVADSIACGIMLTEYARMKYGLYEHANPPPQDPDGDDSEDTSRTGTGRPASKTLKSGKDLDDDGKVKESQRLRDKRAFEGAVSDLLSRAYRTSDAHAQGRKEYDRDSKPDLDAVPEELQAAMNAARDGEVSESMADLMQERGGSGVVAESGAGTYTALILRPDYQRTQHDYGPVDILDDFKFPARGGFHRATQLNVEVQSSVVGGQRKLAEALGMNRRSASTPNLVRGRLHGTKLARVRTGNRRAFRRMDKPRKRSYAVLIGVDQSGSTMGRMNEYLVELAYAQATLLARLGVTFAVAGHTGSQYNFEGSNHVDDQVGQQLKAIHGSSRGNLMTIQLCKNFAEQWDGAAQSALGSLRGSHQNLDGLTMQTYINMLCTQRATDRILLYYTDGQMPAEDHDRQKVLLEAQCRRAKAMAKLPDRRLHVVGIGVGTDAPKAYGLDTILVDEDDAKAGVVRVVEGLADRIAKSISG